MREVLEGRPEQGRADAGPAAPARPRPGRAEVVLLTVAALTLVHLVDHVLRADASGWPFTRDLTWFTASLLVFPALVAAAALLVLVVGVDLAYGWAWASTDRSRLARTIVWQESDVSDYRGSRPAPSPPARRCSGSAGRRPPTGCRWRPCPSARAAGWSSGTWRGSCGPPAPPRSWPSRATRWCPRSTSRATGTTRRSARCRWPSRSCRPWSGSPSPRAGSARSTTP